MISWADCAACLAIDRGSCQVSARSLRLMCQYSSTMLCAWLHAHKKAFSLDCPNNTKTRTPGPTPSSCGVLRSCSSVLSNGAHGWWKTDVGDLFLHVSRINQHLLISAPLLLVQKSNNWAAESFTGSPDSEASWQIIREPSLTAPGMPRKCPVEWRLVFFRAKWNEMKWNEMKWNEMTDLAHDWTVRASLREGFGVVLAREG